MRSVIDAFLAAVKEALARGDGIEIRGFGTFKVRHRKARRARNPRTGEPVELPARDVPVFQPSRHVCSTVDRGYRSAVFGRSGDEVGKAQPTDPDNVAASRPADGHAQVISSKTRAMARRSAGLPENRRGAEARGRERPTPSGCLDRHRGGSAWDTPMPNLPGGSLPSSSPSRESHQAPFGGADKEFAGAPGHTRDRRLKERSRVVFPRERLPASSP